MENYEVLSVAGEGSYGIVMKCRQKNTRKIVAIKKLIDIENDHYVRKMAFREIRILKKLQHDNLVKLLEVFKKKRRFYLVFEFLDRTVLDDLEENPNGLGEQRTKEYMFQLIRGIEFCHSKNVIHRDIKPENLLVSKTGILKLCDFGFARVVNNSNGYCTEYIATRWYRAPELLVRDRKYGKPVDIWAIGCVFTELLTGEPLFPGDSDVDQLYQITKRLGKLCHRHQKLLNNINMQNEIDEFNENSEVDSMNNVHALHNMFPSWSTYSLNIVALCLHLDPHKRPTAIQLLNHEYFEEHNFKNTFLASLCLKMNKRIPKSPIVSEFESKCNSENYSNFSTPRMISVMKTPPASPLESLPLKSSIACCKSPNMPASHKVTDVNNGLNIRRLIPVNVERMYPNDQYPPFEFPRSPSSGQWHHFTPELKFRSLNDYDKGRNSKREDPSPQLPKPEIIQFKKEELTSSKNKTKTVNELNLPLLQVGDSARTKHRKHSDQL